MFIILVLLYDLYQIFNNENIKSLQTYKIVQMPKNSQKRPNSQSKIKNKQKSRGKSASTSKQKSRSSSKSTSKSMNKFNKSNRMKSNNKGRNEEGNYEEGRERKFDRKKKMSGSMGKSKYNDANLNYDNDNDNEQNPQNRNALIQKSKLTQYTAQQQLQLLKQLHSKITMSPQQNIKHVQTIFSLAKTPNLRIVATALRVLAQTFINIAPLDAIDVEKIEERTESKITKEQYKVVRFQKTLVAQYQRYIKMVKQMHLKTKIQNFANDRQVYIQFKKCLLECVVKLYRVLWNFNYAKQLNQLCLKFIKFTQCRQFLKQMLMDKNVALLQVKFRIISGIAKIIKMQHFQKRLPQDIIQIINFTYIDTRYLKKDQESLNYRKKKLKRKLYKQQALQNKKQKQKKAQRGTLQKKRQIKQQKARQKLRVKQQVNKQFAQGESSLPQKQLTRHNSQILQQLFYIYFKILVQRPNSPFLKDTLDGVLKFVHLINIELTQSLIQHLDVSAGVFRELWRVRKSQDVLEMRILVVFTAESIINGPLSVYNMDDVKIMKHFYAIFKDINANKQIVITKQTYRLLCLTLQEAFIRRRQLSQQIVGSFLRQIAIFLKDRPNLPKLYLLQLIRTLVYKYQKLSRMFEEDNEGYGFNSFNPICEDPQCSNAINTQVISYLKSINSKKSKQYQNSIDRYVQKLCKQNFQPKDNRQSLYSILEREIKQQFQ